MADVSATLLEHRALWARKPVLRQIYQDLYRRMAAMAVPGETLELGGGSGNLKDYLKDVTATDIQPASWLDLVADAQRLPFADDSFDNIVMFDVLHHLERPRRFLEEADRVLRPGGRIIAMEPAISPLSQVFYRWLHPEPVDCSADPLDDGPLNPDRDPYAANQAIPTLLFGRDAARMQTLFPRFRIVARERMSLFAYPLSGGFRPWSLVPASWVPRLLRLEDAVAPLLGPVMAFRLLGVLEKTATPD